MTTTTVRFGYYTAYAELLDAPHLLIAGSTGSGKSTLEHSLLYTLTALKTPKNARLILLDPKRVELRKWAKTRFCAAYRDEPTDILRELEKVSDVMESRYKDMQRRELTLWDGSDIYVVIDEFADLMLNKAIEPQLVPIVQHLVALGRAAKVHLWCCTQAPNRQVIPANITIGFTHKICLRCDTAIESRQVILVPGGESLPKHGVMILRSPDGLKKVEAVMTPAEKLNERIKFWTEN